MRPKSGLVDWCTSMMKSSFHISRALALLHWTPGQDKNSTLVTLCETINFRIACLYWISDTNGLVGL